MVYDYNIVIQGKGLWAKVMQIATIVTISWLISEDLNVVTSPLDMLFGNSITSTEIKNFVTYIQLKT